MAATDDEIVLYAARSEDGRRACDPGDRAGGAGEKISTRCQMTLTVKGSPKVTHRAANPRACLGAGGAATASDRDASAYAVISSHGRGRQAVVALRPQLPSSEVS